MVSARTDFDRRRREHGGAEVYQARRLKELKRENARPSKASQGVSDPTLGELFVDQALTGMCLALLAVAAVSSRWRRS